MTAQEALKKSGEEMTASAKAFADRGYKSYEAKLHVAAVGKTIAARIAEGLEPTAANLGAMVHALYNHSAWRQRFEKDGIFAKAENRGSGLDNLLAELDEEGV